MIGEHERCMTNLGILELGILEPGIPELAIPETW